MRMILSGLRVLAETVASLKQEDRDRLNSAASSLSTYATAGSLIGLGLGAFLAFRVRSARTRAFAAIRAAERPTHVQFADGRTGERDPHCFYGQLALIAHNRSSARPDQCHEALDAWQHRCIHILWRWRPVPGGRDWGALRILLSAADHHIGPRLASKNRARVPRISRRCIATASGKDRKRRGARRLLSCGDTRAQSSMGDAKTLCNGNPDINYLDCNIHPL